MATELDGAALHYLLSKLPGESLAACAQASRALDGSPTALEDAPSPAATAAATAAAWLCCCSASSHHELVLCLQVCRAWRDVAASEQLWQQLCLELEPHPHLRRDDLLPGENRQGGSLRACLGACCCVSLHQ